MKTATSNATKPATLEPYYNQDALQKHVLSEGTRRRIAVNFKKYFHKDIDAASITVAFEPNQILVKAAPKR